MCAEDVAESGEADPVVSTTLGERSRGESTKAGPNQGVLMDFPRSVAILRRRKRGLKRGQRHRAIPHCRQTYQMPWTLPHHAGKVFSLRGKLRGHLLPPGQVRGPYSRQTRTCVQGQSCYFDFAGWMLQPNDVVVVLDTCVSQPPVASYADVTEERCRDPPFIHRRNGFSLVVSQHPDPCPRSVIGIVCAAAAL